MPSREELQKEIDWLFQIIRTNEASLKLKTLSAVERTLLESQIKTRGLTLAGLRQKLADLSGLMYFDASPHPIEPRTRYSST